LQAHAETFSTHDDSFSHSTALLLCGIRVFRSKALVPTLEEVYALVLGASIGAATDAER
jgi:hypothetical protein